MKGRPEGGITRLGNLPVNIRRSEGSITGAAPATVYVWHDLTLVRDYGNLAGTDHSSSNMMITQVFKEHICVT